MSEIDDACERAARNVADAMYGSLATGGELNKVMAELVAFAVRSSIKDLIEDLIEAEREACAQIADGYKWDDDYAAVIAAAIRARKGNQA